ncbi:cation transporter [Rhizobium sp. SGZ-381]|uniref:cation transporter n=1 Tax=Rhizobium sp. SGZ-381 TaxID=3342800 RepID=UPI00366B43CF
MSASCGHHHGTFEGLSDDYRRRLWAVIIINAAMFFVEMTAGHMARSQALQADALDFFADAVTYGISLAVIGASLKVRTLAAAAKGASLFFIGLWVFGSTVYRVFAVGVPQAEVMGVIGFLALAANLFSVLLLINYKDGDANVRSVWLCSRNDAIGNVVVMLAATGVWGTASAWPDLVVAGVMAGLFLTSAVQIVRQSWAEWTAKGSIDPNLDPHDHGSEAAGHADACCAGHDHAGHDHATHNHASHDHSGHARAGHDGHAHQH